MGMEQDSTYMLLQEKVEVVAGRKIITPRDFDYLSARIFDKTKTYISPITLKRFWGYLGDRNRKKPYRSTLNTLAIYAGYTNIEAFTDSIGNNSSSSSEILHSPNLQTASLCKGAVIELKWSPGRCVRIRYEGHDMFRVIESQNSKLAAGDTFLCYQFIQQQPLYLRCLVHNNSEPTGYVGKGKYVLVDFWASWCGPCKGEIPNLIELQNKFGGDKFMVLGVNVWDDETAFKAALEEEGITYPQIVVPQNNKDNATELYGIKGIPQIILFAPDGTIVKRDLRGQAMKDLVEEKMK